MPLIIGSGITIEGNISVLSSPTYTYTAPATGTANEGQSITYNITTTFVGSATLYWTIESVTGTVNDADFSSPASAVTMGGSVVITNNAGTFTLTLASDVSVEPTDSFRVNLRTGSTTGPIVATSNVITIGDITYSFSGPATSTVNEGSTVTYTVATTNFGSGTLYWTIEAVSGTINNADFSNPANAVTAGGSVAIVSNSGSFSLTISNDITTEGTESYLVRLRITSTSGTIVATSNTITITDSSRPFDGATWRSSNNIFAAPSFSVAKTSNAVVQGSTFGTIRRSTIAPGTLTSGWTNISLSGGGAGDVGYLIWIQDNGSVTLTGGITGYGGVHRSADGGATWTWQSGLYSTWFSSAFCCAWNGSLWCMGSDNGRIGTSPDGITWTNRTSLSSSAWGSSSSVRSMIWGGDRFVALGTNGKCATSFDGINWTNQTQLATTAWGTSQTPYFYTLAYSASLGLFMAGGNSGQVAYSSDGATWTVNTTALNTAWGATRTVQAMVGTTSHFIAFADNGYAARSTNGSTWTNITSIRNLSSGTFFNAQQAIFTGSNILVAENVGGSSGAIIASP